jgi:hypothetical protein
MSNADFWMMLYLIIRMPYHCYAGIRSTGYWFPGAGYHVHTAITYGGSCIQAFWLAVQHGPSWDWWTA